ncbi:MAG: hypothetical protein AVDCRST_MAG29-1867, partial [uncultured Nocardioidaceae bacterium]
CTCRLPSRLRTSPPRRCPHWTTPGRHAQPMSSTTKLSVRCSNPTPTRG